MSCTILNNIPSGIAKELVDVFGSSDTILESHVLTYMSDEFQTYIDEKFKDEKPTDKEIVDNLRAYYNTKRPDINYSTQLRTKDNPYRKFGYSSVSARELGKRLAANIALTTYQNIIRNGSTPKKEAKRIKKNRKLDKYSVKDFFAELISHKVQGEFVRVAMRLGHSQEEIIEAIKKKDTHTINKWFENASYQDKNVLALFKESKFNSEQERQRFMSEVFRDSRLGECRIDNDRQLTDNTTYEAFDELFDKYDDEIPQDDGNTENNEDKDGSIDTLNNKMGEYNSFMKHIDMAARSYFNSLKKLYSGEKIDNDWDYDTDNDFGIADTMNADQCVAVFYSYGDFTNKDSMIESAKTIADCVPGFAAFHKFAEDLAKDNDFARSMYRTFGKTIIAKIETVVDGSSFETRISNRRTDKLTALTYEFFNAIKTTAITTNRDFNLSKLDTLKKEIKKLEDHYKNLSNVKDENDRQVYQTEIDKQTNKLVNDLTNILKWYFPNISEYSISNYIKNNKINGSANVIDNFNDITDIFRKLINSTTQCQENYNKRKAEISSIYRHNEEVKNNADELHPVNPNDLKDITEAYAKEYITEDTIKAINKLATALVKFTAVSVDLNSRNVHGNQSSSVINNSMITNILKTLQSQIALENFGKYRFQSRQYDFSNIMVEHVENGVTINYGLFRKEGDKFVPTEYANRLLRARLFSGASDAISNKSVLYAEMSKGDYIATSFINYFNVPRDIQAETDTSKIPMANYFMRIPSDAPKNFTITAPKYSTKGLFIVTNQPEVDRLVLERLRSIPELTQEQMYGESLLVDDERDRFDVSYKQIINHLTSAHPYNVTIKNKKSLSDKKAKNGDTVYLTCNYKSEDGINNVYVLKGTLKENNGTIEVVEPELVGVDNSSRSVDVQSGLKEVITNNLYRENKVKTSLNTSHPIYLQFRQSFVQEITDMASFINAIFETYPDGRIKLNNGEPVFKTGFANDAATCRELYKIYHTDGKKIFTVDKTGNIKFTGKVFTSNRFELNGRNYGKEVLDKVFDFFSTGEENKHIHYSITSTGVEVSLTPQQEQYLQEKLTEFIKDYTNDAINRIAQYKNFIPENIYNINNIEEFALNHHLMYIGFDDLFEGNTKFYKNNQDFLKRAKETQGSGVPYGVVDYNIDMTEDSKDIESSLDNAGFVSINENGEKTDYNVKLRTKFRGVTIKNTIRTGSTIGTFKTNSKGEVVKWIKDDKGNLKEDENGNYVFENVGTLSKRLIKNFQNNGMTEEDATTKAANMMAGYSGTKVNDAQSYITFEEWVRRITARGQLPKYKPLIQAILDESKPLDAETIEEFVQVQKNFYYDQHYNSKLGVIAPRQIKNAEFVLVPRLIKGTQLEEVYNMMKECEIDQLNTEETSKAGKCNVLTIWDNNGEISETNRQDFLANAKNASELYSYNYLYTQQETPQHVNAENKAGIQIIKKIIDNIPSTSKLYPIKQKFFKLYCENIHASFEDVMKELKVALDKNGNIKLDENGNISGLKFDTFFSMLKDEVARLGLDSNMMDYVTLAVDQACEDASNGGTAITNMPTFLSSVSTKLESIAQSLFNNRITRQTLPGFHAAQITNIGFRPFSESVKKRSYSKELKYHPDEYKHKKTGEVISEREYNEKSPDEQKQYKNIGASSYIEIMLPASNFGLSRYDKDGRRKSDEELLKELQDAGMDSLIGYRIPTEGKQSICIMKVVGFTDDAYGSTIVVPDDWVAQTGSDFDLDSVYGIQFKGKYNKDGKFTKYEYREGDKNSSAQRNGRNNELLQCMIDILSSDEALEENLSRSNFEDIIEARDKAISEEAKQERKNRSPYNVFDQADYQEDVMGGAKLKAFSVTRDTFCSVCNTVRPTLTGNNTINVIYHASDGYTFENLSKSFDKVTDLKDGRFLVEHNTFGWSKDNKNVAGKILTAYSSQTTAHILDAVKEGAIPNVNDYTFQVYKMFPDIGSDYNTGIPFIMQNGIKRIVDAYNNNKSIYSIDSDNPIYAAIKDVASKLLAMDGESLSKYPTIAETIEKLEKYSEELAKLFGVDGDFKISLKVSDISKLPLDGNLYRQQLKSPFPVEKQRLLFDLGVILQYYKLNNLGNTISSYARVCNPDKFGAKQTLFSTNKVFEDIEKIITDERKAKVITVGDKSFLEAVYPGIVDKDGTFNLDNFIKSTDMNSAYPSLHYFLKYATATSIKINRNLFPETQSPIFINTVNSLRFAFTGENKQMTEQIYKDFQNYILNRLYTKTSAIKFRASYKVGEGFIFTDEDLEKERRRIFGFGYKDNLEAPIIKEIKTEHKEELNSTEQLFADKGLPYAKAAANLEGISTILHFLSDKQRIKIEKELADLKAILNKNNVTEEELNAIVNYKPKVVGSNNIDAVNRYYHKDNRRGFDAYQNKAIEVYKRAIKKKELNEQEDVTYEETDNYSEFKVEDINNPTQLEIERFSRFTPAQKVMWIQANFRESGVFKYIRANLFNEYKYRKNKSNAQEIEFIENNENIETVYYEFEKCFYNNNPFIALGALDLIKYGFMVEGFKMKKNAVYKVIRNSALMDSDSPHATAIADELRARAKTIAFEDTDTLIDDFVRSHSDLSKIAIKRVKKVGKGKTFELPYANDYAIGLDLSNKDDRTKALKFKLGYESGTNSEFTPNKYVKLRYDKNTILYKIKYDAATERLIAYPLNLLESTEGGTWSANTNNNKYMSEDYYSDLVDKVFNYIEESESIEVTNEDTSENENKENAPTTARALISKFTLSTDEKKAYRFHNDMTVKQTGYSIPFNINDKNSKYTGGFEAVIDAVEKHFSNFPLNEPLIIRSAALAKHISSGSNYQWINGRKYEIKPYSLRAQNARYIGKRNVNHKVKEKNPQVQAIMEKAQSSGEYGYRVTDAFIIQPATNKVVKPNTVVPNEKYSSVTEFGVNSMKTIARQRAAKGDKKAEALYNLMEGKGITADSKSVEQHINEVIPFTSEYVETVVDRILNDLNYFIQDTNGKWHGVNDPVTMDLIRNNPEERNRFLKTILDARAFIKNYQLINELDLDSEDETIRPALRKIKENINKLQNATSLSKAEEQFALNYLSRLSNNPLIQGDIITMLDGYHSASAFDAWVNDLQETSSPLLQIITREVMGDIRAKEMKAKDVALQFRKQIKAIEEKAKKAGRPINWKHIIDDDGKFIQEYNNDFVEEIQRLRQAIKDAKEGFDEGTTAGIEKYLRTKLEYDKFKLKNTHQPLVDEYYERRIKAQEYMLDKFPTIYCAYQKLADEKREILSHVGKDGLEESYEERLKEIKQEMANLTNSYIYDPDTDSFIEKVDIGNPNNPFTGEKAKLFSSNAAYALQDYLKEMSDIYKEYFTQDAKYGFEEELEKHLDIINIYENVLKMPMSERLKHEDYVTSRDWLNNNTRYVVTDDLKDLINEAFKTLKETNQGRHILKTIAKRLDAYDNHGVIDATKFSEKEIEAVFNETKAKYDIHESQPFSDKALITCAPDDDTLFTSAFYKGMTSNGASNREYYDIVEQINTIIRKYYDTASRTIDTYEMFEEDIRALDKLYDKLEDTKKTKGATNKKAVSKFIKDHVEFVYNMDEYNRNKELVIKTYGTNSKEYRLWTRVNERIEEDENGNLTVVPNRYIYGYAIPKGYKKDGTGDNTYVDKKKTEALRTLKKHTTVTRTEYYYKKFKEMQALGKKAFDDWYYKNHVYNPHTHTMEPISCWMKLVIHPVSDDGEYKPGGEYVPAYNQLQSRPKNGKDKNGNPTDDIDAVNYNYKGKGSSTASNFKRSAEAKYHNNIVMTDEEREIKDIFTKVLYQNATTSSARRFLDSGYMASRAKNPKVDAKFVGKELAKMVGWIESNTGREPWSDHPDYSRDVDLDMPMMSILKSKDSIKVPNNPPVKQANESEEDYKKRLDEYDKAVADAKAKNQKIHKDMLDDNWVSVMEEFIIKSAHFNAVQDNKYMLFYAKNMIDKLNVYKKNLGTADAFGGTSRFRKDSESVTGYAMERDKYLNEQFENWIRRLVYDQWKKPNTGLTRAANILQSISSAKFMMINILGGVANVTVGEANIFLEIVAKDYIGGTDWLKGKRTWFNNIPAFFRDMYSEKATTLGSAIIKHFEVVDFDQHNGVVETPDAATWFKRTRDLGFSPQAMGEHFMQNGVLFSMLHSHRLIKNPNPQENGKTSYIYINEAQHSNMVNDEALKDMLKDNLELQERYIAFKQQQLESPESTKEYAWFRRDLATEFANNFLSHEQQKDFIKRVEKKQKEKKEEFAKLPTLMDQLKLTEDGRLGFKDGSILSTLGDEAYQILGRFKGSVISVNKKIHGVYDKLGAAQIESTWWGGLVMQYHKHIYPGLMKRWRRHGYFNEERASIEKGSYASLVDFLALPIHKAKYARKLKNETGISDAEIERLEGIQNIFKNYVEFAIHVKTYWHIIPENERGNIKRVFADFAGVIGALCLSIALHCIYDDDDDSFIYNFCIYEADRLASESMMYNPYFAAQEAKKLWSSPTAFQGGITDLIDTIGLLSKYLLYDDFDMTYKSGIYAKENKLMVKLKRNIPGYHSINMMKRLKKNNKYYKLDKNMLSIVPVKDIADFITD